jgi:putative ABC transport system permease protein
MTTNRGDIKVALSSLRSNRWRSLLTMLGIIIGVVSVIVVVGIGEGVRYQISQEVNQFGKDLITVRPGHVNTKSGISELQDTDLLFGLNSVNGLSEHDVQAIENTPHVAIASPLGVVPGEVEANGQTFNNTTVLATNSDLPGVLNQSVLYGSFFSPGQSQEDVAVLGQSLAQKMFQEYVPLGHQFTFRGRTFIVGGIFSNFDSSPLSPTANFNNDIFIPYQAADQLTGTSTEMYTILAKPDNPGNVNLAVNSISKSLASANGGGQDFSVLSPAQQIATSGQVLDLLTNLITGVAIVSLIVGGVGIMNVMLVSVTERMHEIGVRKAIGATSQQILKQFMLEATVLSITGALIGVVIGVVIDLLLRIYSSLQPIISLWAILISTLVSILVGVIFGVIPAIKAARKDPIDALRNE